MSYELDMADYHAEKKESFEDLIELRQQLCDELADAVNDGSANQMLWLDGKIKELNTKLFAVQVADIKLAIDEKENRKVEILKEIDALSKLKILRNDKLQEVLAEAQRHRADVGRAEVALTFAENENRNVRISILELNRKLENLKQAKLKEINNKVSIGEENSYGRFN